MVALRVDSHQVEYSRHAQSPAMRCHRRTGAILSLASYAFILEARRRPKCIFRRSFASARPAGPSEVQTMITTLRRMPPGRHVDA
jgi:hypothetical protein